MTSNDVGALAGLEDEAKQLHLTIAQCEAAARDEFKRTGNHKPRPSLMAFRNRLMVVELRIARIKFGPSRTV